MGWRTDRSRGGVKEEKLGAEGGLITKEKQRGVKQSGHGERG